MKKRLWNSTLLTLLTLNSFGQGILKFNKEAHIFGKVEEGPVISYSFEAINKGDSPILITKTESSCGCVLAEWADETISPNQKSTIKISFKTEGRLGVFTKVIQITSDAKNKISLLTINGEVIEKGSLSLISTKASTKAPTNKEIELAQSTKYIYDLEQNKQKENITSLKSSNSSLYNNSNNAEMERLNLERPCIFNFYETEKKNDDYYYHYELKIPLKNGEYDIKKYGGRWITHYTENNYWFANGTGKSNADFKTKNEAIAYTAKYYGCANWYEQK